MKTVDEIRRENLAFLIKQCKSLKQFSEIMGKSPAQISQWLNGSKDSTTGKKRGMSDATARSIEQVLEKQKGWLDQDHQKDNSTTSIYSANQPIAEYSNLNHIKMYNEKGGSMGRGIILSDQPGQITNMVVTDEWLDKNVPSNTGKKNLSIVTGFGDSMKGMFNPGDPLLVDSGVNVCDHDGVFFFRIGNEGYVKKLQRIPNVGIRVISKNSDYETWTITEDMDFEVLAKVLKVWESENF